MDKMPTNKKMAVDGQNASRLGKMPVDWTKCQ